jgi:excisionase family DNA binding protein
MERAAEVELNQQPDWLTPADLAVKLQVSPDAVIDMANRGQLPHLRIGRLYRFRRESYESLASNINATAKVEAVRKVRASSRRFISGPVNDEFSDL